MLHCCCSGGGGTGGGSIGAPPTCTQCLTIPDTMTVTSTNYDIFAEEDFYYTFLSGTVLTWMMAAPSDCGIAASGVIGAGYWSPPFNGSFFGVPMRMGLNCNSGLWFLTGIYLDASLPSTGGQRTTNSLKFSVSAGPTTTGVNSCNSAGPGLHMRVQSPPIIGNVDLIVLDQGP